jgi:signal transduction histidine kinase
LQKNIGLMLFCLLFLSACRIWDRIDTHELDLARIKRHDSSVSGWIFADLKGDGSELPVFMDDNLPNLHSIYVQDITGKTMAQTNSPYKIRNLSSLQDKRDGSRWMFYSYNDQRRVYLDAKSYIWKSPLQSISRSFESLARNDARIDNPRIEYYGQLYPKYLDDIDGDGGMDLLCLALDGFNANPRGLVLYDFDSGKIKWRFEMPCNINTLIWDDFDNNGTREILFSTQAVKNTTAVINGMDDASSFLGMLSGQGKLLFLEKQFSGYGLINLAVADTDQDQKKEIFAIHSYWGNELQQRAAAVYNWNGQRLVRQISLDSPWAFDRHQNPFFLQKPDNKENYVLLLTDSNKGLVALDPDLNELREYGGTSVAMIYAIADLNGNGEPEIVLQTSDDHIEVLDIHFHRKARLKNPFPNENLVSVETNKTGLDSDHLVSIGSSREIRYYRYHPVPFWVLIYRLFIAYSPILSVFFLIMYPVHSYFNAQRRKLPFMGVNYLSEGVLLMKNARRILFHNQSAFETARESKDPSCRNLELCFPRLYTEMQTFIAGRLSRYDTTLVLFPEKDDREYQIVMFKAHSLVVRYMIVFGSCEPEESYLRERMQWADTARRLSHHVRRHITNIILSLDALATDNDPNRREYHQIIRTEINKVRVFTHSFQRFTELKDYDLKLQDIIPSIEHCLARTKLPENISLVKSWDLFSVEAYIEPIRFEEAVTNIINNALEAMPEGGTLHIMVKKFPWAASQHGSGRILVEVEDNGKGIPAKYMEDIWKPFFTTNQSGTGIGIPETKKIIDSMGGSMDVQSEKGIGTTVTFWLKGAENE